jgi:hypothetical protein
VNATVFQTYLETFHSTFQRPLWITEWACQNYNNVNAQCSDSDIVEFLNKTQSFMDQAPFVERYAWFGAMENMQGVNPVGSLIYPLSDIDNIWRQGNALMDSSGKINDLGRQYIGAGNSPAYLSRDLKRMAPSIPETITIALTALIGVLSLFY